MKAKGSRGSTLALAVLLASLAALLVAAEKPEAAQNWGAGLELLVNGDFDGPMERQSPAGWFKAMAWAQTDGLQAGIEQVPPRGNVAFIEQTGVKVKVANNWAQRVQTIPVGATVRVTADVKTQDLPTNTGFVTVQCWDEAQRLIGGASSQSAQAIGGTEDWKRISFEFVVPPGTDAMILRCGLAQSGKIRFDNISMKAVSGGAGAAGGLRGSPGTTYAASGTPSRGFQVTEESLRQLQRVRTVSDGLVTYAQRELGTEVRIRREILAQGDGRFQVVLSLDLSKPQ
jgi:hypothetical protein